MLNLRFKYYVLRFDYLPGEIRYVITFIKRHQYQSYSLKGLEM